MSELDRLVNACLLPGFHGTDVPEWIERALDGGLAGVTIFPHNLDGSTAVAHLAARVRGRRDDALVAIDEEGGDVTRLHYGSGSPYPGSLALGIVNDLALTREVSSAIAADLVASGVNYNLAPSLDVNSDPENPVIGVRSFGADPDLVAAHGLAFAGAMAAAGVACAGKHFPGHGATVTDSHHGEIPVVTCDLETFRRRELAPFVAAVRAGVPSLMVGHVVYPAVDPDRPATLSRTILHDLARTELGYDGVLLSTAPALDPAHLVDASVRALTAGADLLLLGPIQGEGALAAIRAGVADAVRGGELALSTLEGAGRRVATMRAWAAPRPVSAIDPTAGLRAARQAARASGDVVLSGPASVVEVRAPGNIVAGEAYWSLADRLAELGLLATDGADDAPLVIVVRDAYRDPEQRAWVRSRLADRPDAVLVAIGMPDDATLTAGPSIQTYGAGRVNTQVAAELLAGRRHA
jgi:beta-N-acetylhexosaminidase